MSEFFDVELQMRQAEFRLSSLLKKKDTSPEALQKSILELVEWGNQIRKHGEYGEAASLEYALVEAIRHLHNLDPEIGLNTLHQIADMSDRIKGPVSLSKAWSADKTNLRVSDRAALFPQVLQVFQTATHGDLKAAAGHQVVALSFYHTNTAEIGSALRSVFEYAQEADNKGLEQEAAAMRKSLWKQLRQLHDPHDLNPASPPSPAK